jgi:hypothetical protein
VEDSEVFNMALLDGDSINLLLLVFGFLALVLVLVYTAFEGSSDDDEESN